MKVSARSVGLILGIIPPLNLSASLFMQVLATRVG